MRKTANTERGRSMAGPKVFVWDLENSTILSEVWSLWNNNLGLSQIREDWYCLSWSGKWLGEDYIYSDSLFSHKETYANDPTDDTQLMLTLWDFLNEADIVLGHNMRAFDMKKARARMLINGIEPFSPCQVIDTLEIAKKSFKMTSNKLQYIAGVLGLGEKVETGGQALWTKCMQGNRAAWKLMVEYNEEDVILTEDVYNRLAPWATGHPNFGLYHADKAMRCNRCGSEDVVKNGTRTVKTSFSIFQEYKCKSCGSYPRGRENLADRSNLLANTI